MKKVNVKLSGSEANALLFIIMQIGKYGFKNTLADVASRQLLRQLFLRLVGRTDTFKPEGNRLSLSFAECWAFEHQSFAVSEKLGIYENNVLLRINIAVYAAKQTQFLVTNN
jgi:hypothetical protein